MFKLTDLPSQGVIEMGVPQQGVPSVPGLPRVCQRGVPQAWPATKVITPSSKICQQRRSSSREIFKALAPKGARVQMTTCQKSPIRVVPKAAALRKTLMMTTIMLSTVATTLPLMATRSSLFTMSRLVKPPRALLHSSGLG